MKRQSILLIILTFLFQCAYAQNTMLKGTVVDDEGAPVYFASVSLMPGALHLYTNNEGVFCFSSVPADTVVTLTIQSFGKVSQQFKLQLHKGETRQVTVKLLPDVQNIDTVYIDPKTKQPIHQRREVSLFKIDPKIPKVLPSAFNDFNKILVTLPGVSANNELSSQYSVRGGNFDENLVYVNDIEIYRPFLTRGGQQEGLSFVNPDLVRDIEFSAGGWQPRFGDKLSSVLSVKYKVPYRFKASGSASLLGGTFHVENASKNERVAGILGVRYKSAQYLLNTLATKGEYKPRFFDVQSYLHFNLSRRDSVSYSEPRTTLGVLTSVARNSYFVIPTERETNFGTSSQVIQLKVDFEGKETIEYETFQSGLKLSHRFTNRLHTDWIASVIFAGEREYSDVEGSYRLSEIDTDPNSSQFNQPIFNLGSGSLFDHSRNKLTASIFTLSHKAYYNPDEKNSFQWGISQGVESLKDQLSEYSFIDSVGYVTITEYLESGAELDSWRTQGYAQHSWEKDSLRAFTYGVRFNYWSLNRQLLVSPRLQYAWQLRGDKDILYKVAVGLYQQPPFYRELRAMDGTVNRNLKAQSSVHLIAGRDQNFKAWNRDFKFTAEVYAKYLYNVVPYDIDNVRIRYYAHNNAKAYAAGMDFRVNGEFIRNAESWFSVGVMTTREDIEGDGRGFIKRPTDQRVMAAIFFQDHLPNNPSIKANVNLVFASGLPFGPPGSAENRSSFTAPPYRRLDIGFSKLISYADKEVERKTLLESLWISFEVLNILGVNNTISYTWITDVNQNRFAVPNTLSQRFLNLRIVANI